MTRLGRIIDLIEKYERCAILAIDDECFKLIAKSRLDDLKEEKDKLIAELVEHGCRRKA